MGTFEQDLLNALGAPDTFQNNTALTAWEDSEGVPAQDFNPLAITDPYNRYPHAGIVAQNGGNPVYAFPDQATGVRATADFINGGYPGIKSAFVQNSGLAAIYQAVNRSAWCQGCQGGYYPTKLFQFAYDSSQGSGVSTPGHGLDTVAQQKAAQDAARKANPCALNLPVVGCVIHLNTLKKAGGVALMASGGLVMLIGTYVIISRFGATRRLTAAVGAVPGVRRNAPASSERPFREGESEDSSANRRLYQRRQRAARSERDEGERESARTAVIREREGARQRRMEDRYDEAS